MKVMLAFQLIIIPVASVVAARTSAFSDFAVRWYQFCVISRKHGAFEVCVLPEILV